MTSKRRGILFVSSGPSGTGKTTLCRLVEKRLEIPHAVSFTTRPKRPNEIHGKDYYFVDETTFDQMIAAEEFLEWAFVHRFRYGTPRGFIEQSLNQGQDLILDLDTQGALAVKLKQKEAVLIFVDTAHHLLVDRLQKRGTEPTEYLESRLKQAETERSFKAHYDYQVVNDDLEKSYEDLARIIQRERALREGV